jgi:hypothetical protein
MSRAQEKGLLEVLGEAEGLARVLRRMSDGRIDLVAMVRSSRGGSFDMVLPWGQAATEARAISRSGQTLAARAAGAAETFCSVCGPLDEPGVHTMADCPRYQQERDHGGPAAARMGQEVPK